MPRKTEVIEPELAFQFGGLHVYHTHRDNESDGPVNEYWYMLGDPRQFIDDTNDDEHFDVRDLAFPTMSSVLRRYMDLLPPLGEARFRFINTLLHAAPDELDVVRQMGGQPLPDLIASHCQRCGCQLPKWSPDSVLVMPCLMCSSDEDLQTELDMLQFHAADLEAETSTPQLGAYPRLECTLEIDMVPEAVENTQESGNLAFTAAGWVIRETVKSTGDETASFTLSSTFRKLMNIDMTDEEVLDRFTDRWVRIRSLQPCDDR